MPTSCAPTPGRSSSTRTSSRGWIGQRVQQRGIDHAVDRGCRSHAQRHCGDRNERKSRRPAGACAPRSAGREQILDEGQALLGVVVSRIAAAPPSLIAAWRRASLGRHSGAHILFGLEREMLGDLFLQPLVGALAHCEIETRVRKRRRRLMPRSSALTLKKRAIIAAVCSHSRVSPCDCLRPAASGDRNARGGCFPMRPTRRRRHLPARA